MAQADASRLDGALQEGNISAAWVLWSSAAEAALSGACCFAGGLVPGRGLVRGRGIARSRIVSLGGPKVREARTYAADPLDGWDVFMHRDSSIAKILDLRRWVTVVMDVLGETIRGGFTLARSLELTVQLACILRAAPVHPVSLDDFSAVSRWGYWLVPRGGGGVAPQAF